MLREALKLMQHSGSTQSQRNKFAAIWDHPDSVNMNEPMSQSGDSAANKIWDAEPSGVTVSSVQQFSLHTGFLPNCKLNNCAEPSVETLNNYPRGSALTMSDSIRSIKLQSSDKCSLLNCFDLFHIIITNDSGDRRKQTCTFKIKFKNGGVNEGESSLDWTLHTPSRCHIYWASDVGIGFFF